MHSKPALKIDRVCASLLARLFDHVCVLQKKEKAKKRRKKSGEKIQHTFQFYGAADKCCQIPSLHQEKRDKLETECHVSKSAKYMVRKKGALVLIASVPLAACLGG